MPSGPRTATTTAAIVLRHFGDPLVEQHLDIRQGSQPVENQTRRLVLLALDDVRIRGVVREQRVIEFSDTLAGRSIPEADGRRDQADTDHVVDEAGGAEDFECARVRGRGARVVLQRGVLIEQAHVQTATAEQ